MTKRLGLKIPTTEDRILFASALSGRHVKQPTALTVRSDIGGKSRYFSVNK